MIYTLLHGIIRFAVSCEARNIDCLSSAYLFDASCDSLIILCIVKCVKDRTCVCAVVVNRLHHREGKVLLANKLLNVMKMTKENVVSCIFHQKCMFIATDRERKELCCWGQQKAVVSCCKLAHKTNKTNAQMKCFHTDPDRQTNETKTKHLNQMIEEFILHKRTYTYEYKVYFCIKENHIDTTKTTTTANESGLKIICLKLVSREGTLLGDRIGKLISLLERQQGNCCCYLASFINGCYIGQ